MISLGRIGEVTRRLVSPDLASDTSTIRAQLLRKFPNRNESDGYDDEVVQSPDISFETISSIIYSFRRGVGPGPDGRCGDFLRDLYGQRFDEESIDKIFHDLVQLLTDGQGPDFLRPFFGGGSSCGI